MQDGEQITETSTAEAAEIKNYLLVTHNRPDTDALACLWFAIRFLVGTKNNYKILTARAGEKLSEEEEAGYDHVMYMDTGGGDADQHGKRLKNASSFKLLVETAQPEVDPALLPIIDLTVAVDNVYDVGPTSIHQVLLGLSTHFWNRESRAPDWQSVTNFSFIAFDVLYDREKSRLKYEANFDKQGKLIKLPNGITVGDVGFRPQLRDAAFNRGADVVVWMSAAGERKFHPGIQVNRKHMHQDKPALTLWGILEDLRRAEAKARGVDVRRLSMWDMQPLCVDGVKVLGAWFGHDSGGLVACGTKTHIPTDDERTKLSPGRIVSIVTERLSFMSPITKTE